MASLVCLDAAAAQFVARPRAGRNGGGGEHALGTCLRPPLVLDGQRTRHYRRGRLEARTLLGPSQAWLTGQIPSHEEADGPKGDGS